jgi:FkbM family methyltransferase
MPEVTVGALLGRARRVLRFPDMVMAQNFTSHARYPAVAPTDDPVRLVDVGACVGGWTAAQLMAAPNAYVECFEPNERALPYLKNNVGWSKRVAIHVCAASDRAGITPITVDPTNFGKTSFYGSGGETASVITRRLDDEVGGRVDLLKIDAEGHEMHVLAGAVRILTEERPLVLVEVLGEQMARGGWSEYDLTRFMLAHGYGGPTPANGNDWLFRPKGK